MAVTLILIFAASCYSSVGKSKNGKSSLIGSWASVEVPGTLFIFNGDGTGCLDANGTIMNFSYTDNGSKVEITYEGTSTAQVNEYNVKENILLLSNPDYDSALTYRKK